MSFQSARAAVIREELDFLSGKDELDLLSGSRSDHKYLAAAIFCALRSADPWKRSAFLRSSFPYPYQKTKLPRLIPRHLLYLPKN